ncbi:MAG: hypothetical protein QOG53_3303 [Frankiales bacterium]|jgi:putative serine protease PepD|nr:hypothetical protein [Frankiales bacterium]
MSQDPGDESQKPDEAWWSKPGSAQPPWQPPEQRWGLPTDNISGGAGFTSTRLALPIVFVLLIIVALLAAGIGAAVGLNAADDRSAATTHEPVTLGSPQSTTRVERQPNSFASIAARILPSVVQIDVKAGSGGDTGSGFVIRVQGTTGYILTNNHVVSAAATDNGTVRVVFQSGQSVPARIIGRAPTSDLAVLQVLKVNGLKQANLGNSDRIAVGDPVIAIGSPLGLAGTVTSGIVSALNRPVDASGSGTDTNAVIDAIQTDAAINPGNSGGPLVDSSGAVIGVNSAIATLGAGSTPFGQDQGGNIGLGFAIPSNGAKDIAAQIIAKGFAERPIIGVNLNLAYTGTPEGALIGCPSAQRGSCTAVQSGGPGDKAGLREGDVIVAVDGKVTTGPDEVIIATRQHKPGDVVRITVVRGSARKTVNVTLGRARA